MSLRNRKLTLDEFQQERTEVMATWPTGTGVDFEDGVRYQLALPDSKRFSSVLAQAVRENKTLCQPRAGVALVDDTGERHLPAQVVKAVDTTAAGDTFTGYLLADLMSGEPIAHALDFAAKASALAVSRRGAAPSIPMREEVAVFTPCARA